MEKMGLEKNLSLAAVCSLDTRWSSGYTDQQMPACWAQETYYLHLMASMQKTDVPINVWFEFFPLVKYGSHCEAILDELLFVYNYLVFIYLPIY